MKWVNLLWSVVVLGFITLFFARLSTRSTGPISGAVGYAAIVWITILVISPIILLLRIFRAIKNSSFFIYILTGTANFAIGIPGLYFVFHSNVSLGYTTTFLLLLNILMGSFVYIDTFITTIPGYRTTK